MSFTDIDLEAFEIGSAGKDRNDGDNKSRELVIATLINISESELESLRKRIKNGFLLSSVLESLDQALKQISEKVMPESAAPKFSVKTKAGRTNNYDFDLLISDKTVDKQLAVELKKGTSIYDQPQFLQLYVNSTDVTSERIPNYAEYFFDNYFSELQLYSGCSQINRDQYVKEVFGTTYKTEPFSQLYRMVKVDEEGKNWLKLLQYESIDSYIKVIMDHPETNINWKALQGRLLSQVDKYFLSWNPALREFSWEQFDEESLRLTGNSATKKKTNGLRTSLRLSTSSGQSLDLLLRWKNNPCVKGPAWQIKLSAPSQ